FFVYSGRGARLGDGRATMVPEDVTAEIRYLERPVHTLCESADTRAQCLTVEELAELTQGRSLVAIFDTQSTPVAGRWASLIDKYVFPANQVSADDDTPFRTSFYLYPKSEKYPHALMVWLEGRVPNIPAEGAKIDISSTILIDAFEDQRISNYFE